MVQQDDTTLLWFAEPAERFLLITTPAQAEALQQKLAGEAQLNDSTQWLALDIAAGVPVIDSATTAQLIPQATNLQALDAISFKKAVTPAGNGGARQIPRRQQTCALLAGGQRQQSTGRGQFAGVADGRQMASHRHGAERRHSWMMAACGCRRC